MLARHEPEPGGEVPTVPEVRHGGSEGLDRHGGYRSDAGHAAQAGGDGARSARPDPAAPPCMRQRFLPLTAGDMQGLPERVFAPHRRLERIGPVLRG